MDTTSLLLSLVLGVVLLAAVVALVLVVGRPTGRRRAEEGGTSRRDEDGRQIDAEIVRQRDEVARLRDDVERRELRLADRESRLDAENRQLDDRSAELTEHDAELDHRRSRLAGLETERRQELQRVSGLSADEARAELVTGLEHEARLVAARTVREIERTAQEDGEAVARRILTTAIQRLAAPQTAESVVSLLPCRATR